MNKSKAFSLFELVLVVLLLGVVYALVIFPNTTIKTKSKITSLPLLFQEKDDTLIVYDRCKKVARFSKNNLLSFDEPLSFAKSITVYKLGGFSQLEVVDFSDEIIDTQREDVCLKLRRYSNGTVDSLVLNIGSQFFIIGPFDTMIQQATSLEKAATLLDVSKYMPTDLQRYHHD